jgi:hypothetical protein
MTNIFEGIKDRDAYDNQVSNLNKYGSGQETWDDYQSESAGAMGTYTNLLSWGIFIPACLIVAWRIFGLHNKPIFDKIVVFYQNMSEKRLVKRAKNIILGFWMALMSVFIVYLCSLAAH